MMLRTHERAGFTFIELVVVILIIGILAVTIGPGLLEWVGKSKDKKALVELKALKQAVQIYSVDIGSYPHKLLDLVQKPSSGEGAHKWRRAYLDPDSVKIVEGNIVDPWNSPYHYRVTQGGKHPFELYSDGDLGSENPIKIDAWEK